MSLRVAAQAPALFLTGAVLVATPAFAVEPMVGAELTWTHIRVAGETFNPLGARVRLALGVTPEWEVGVLGGSGIEDDSEVTVTTALGEFHAAYVRYSASIDDNARLVLTGGYGQTTLDVTSALPGFPGEQTYSGLLYGLSLQERLSRHRNWIGSLDFERWYDDEGLTITTVSYGFRYAF